MRDTLPDWITTLAWRASGVTLVMGLALFCGRFVEEAAQARHAQTLAARVPQSITPLSATLTGGHVLDLAPPPALLPKPDCPADLAVAAEDGAMLGVTLQAPCAGGEMVTLTHAGLSFDLRLPAGRPLQVSFPALQADGRIDIRLPDGSHRVAAAPVPRLKGLRRFAIGWTGPEGFDLQGQDGPVMVTSEEPGHPNAEGRAWIMRLGEPGSGAKALVFTYPDLMGEVTALAGSTATSCGQSLIGRTVSSQEGVAEAAELRVDLPDCVLGDLILPLKNLDPETKVALR